VDNVRKNVKWENKKDIFDKERGKEKERERRSTRDSSSD
jgi:hypothetical protein